MKTALASSATWRSQLCCMLLVIGETALQMASEVHVSDDLSGSSDSDINNSDVESSASGDAHQGCFQADRESEDIVKPSKTGLADVFSKILRKKTLRKGPAILAKGKTDREILEHKRKQKKENQEGDGSSKPKKVKEDEDIDDDESDDDPESDQKQRLKRKLWEEIGHVKPDILDRNKERNLQKIATRGVVQLFNAVRMQQRSLDDKLKEVGMSVSKREKVVQSMSKGKFLDVLKGGSRDSGVMNVTASAPQEKVGTEKVSAATKEETEKPAWGILRDDFMMGAQMKDWDKQESSSDSDDNEEASSGDSDMT